MMRAGKRGATLIDVVVGTALMLIVFVGIVGAFRLAIDVVLNNKARAGAIALANERLEYIRSLQYDAIGVVGGVPAGLVPQTEGVELNGVTYTRRTYVTYQDDPDDGLGSEDSNGIMTDYKAVKSIVTWESREGTRTISLVTRISPPTGIEYAVPGGALSVVVVDANTNPVPNAQVNIVNTELSPAVDVVLFTDTAGRVNLLGAPPASGYQVTVTKAGYSIAQTYAATPANTNPNPAHLAVALNQTTVATFAVDLLSTIHVRTYETIQDEEWTNDLDGIGSVDATSTAQVSGGVAQLPELEGSYDTDAFLLSLPITPAYLAEWREFSWAHALSAQTSIRYRLYDAAGAALSDAELPGNGSGFTSSPVDLRNLSTSTRPSIRVGAEFHTDDSSVTPEIDTLTVSYASGPAPLPDIGFTLRGMKSIGSNASGTLVYKYTQTHSSGPSAGISIGNAEWDVYSFTVDDDTGYDIASSCAPQPVTIPPGASITTSLYLAPHTPHSLRTDVFAGGGVIVPGARVRLYRTGYDETRISDSCGQAFFEGLIPGSVSNGTAYTIEITADGYQPYSSSEVTVSGTSNLTVILVSQ